MAHGCNWFFLVSFYLLFCLFAARHFAHNMLFFCPSCTSTGEPMLTSENCIVVTSEGQFIKFVMFCCKLFKFQLEGCPAILTYAWMPIFGRNTIKMYLISENVMGKHAVWIASVQCLAKSLVFVAVIPKSTTKNHFPPAYHSPFFHFFWSFLSTGRYDVNFCIFHCKDCKNVFSPLDSSNLIQAGYWPGSIS